MHHQRHTSFHLGHSGASDLLIVDPLHEPYTSFHHANYLHLQVEDRTPQKPVVSVCIGSEGGCMLHGCHHALCVVQLATRGEALDVDHFFSLRQLWRKFSIG